MAITLPGTRGTNTNTESLIHRESDPEHSGSDDAALLGELATRHSPVRSRSTSPRAPRRSAMSDDAPDGRSSLIAPSVASASYSLQGVVGWPGHVPSGPAGAGSGWLPGTRLPGTPFTDSVE